MQTFNQPYRVRKEGGIFSSIIGAFIGILFVVIGSPLAAWYAESQNRADDFSTAQVVAADSATDGYVVVENTAKSTEDLACPNIGIESIGKCIYVGKNTEKYSVERKEQCGSLSDSQVQIEYKGQECDSDGKNCESCYMVDEYSWNQISTDSNYAKFAVGSYSVKASDQTNFIGSQEYTQYESTPTDTTNVNNNANANLNTNAGLTTPDGHAVGDIRHNYSYFPIDDVALVAGDAKTQAISGATDGKPFIVSNTGYAGTVAALESQDRTMAWGLRILSLALMVIGVVMIFGPLTAFTNIFRFIPILGKRLDKGFDAVITFVAALIGFVLWLGLFAIVMVLKNIWIIIIVLGVIGAGVLFLVKRGKKKSTVTPSTTPPSSTTSPKE